MARKKTATEILAEVDPEDVLRYSTGRGLKQARSTFRKISQSTRSERDPSVRGGRNPFLLTKDSAKLRHNDTSGLRQVMKSSQKIQYLDPANSSGLCNTCAWSTAGCRGACLRDAGQMGLYPGADLAPTVRTRFLVEEPAMYLGILNTSITNHENHSRRIGKRSVVRLNGTSDIPFHELPAGEVIIGGHPRTMFSEYTKRNTRGVVHSETPVKFPNVSIIRSVNEHTTADRIRQITTTTVPGYSNNVAVPFAVPSPDFEFPDEMRLTDTQGKHIDLFVVKEPISQGRGRKKKMVSVGDLHDQRYADPKIGGIVALREKILTSPEKRGRKDVSNFIRPIVIPETQVASPRRRPGRRPG